jgi:hypothetical protein
MLLRFKYIKYIRFANSRLFAMVSDVKGKVKIGHGGPQGCERLRLPHYLDKRLIDGGKVVSPTPQSH